MQDDALSPAPPDRDHSRHARERVRIGWRERVDVPAWHLRGILAKVDTGARTSAIDVADIQEYGHDRVRFHVVLSRRHRHRRLEIEARIKRRTRVRSSFGHVEPRLIVEAAVRIGVVNKTIELGLVCRKDLQCRMLLGRSAIQPDFLVDAGHTYVLSRKSKAGRAKDRSKRRVTSRGRKARSS